MFYLNPVYCFDKYEIYRQMERIVGTYTHSIHLDLTKINILSLFAHTHFSPLNFEKKLRTW